MSGVATWQWLLGAVVLLGSSFASGTETALTALGDLRARQLADSSGRRARLLRLWVEHPERVLSSLLVANTIFNIGGGALAGDVASSIAAAHGYSPAKSLGLATGIATTLVLFFGEVVPKTLAKRHSARLAVFSIPFVHILYWLLWPVSSGLVRATHALVRLFGGGPGAPGPAVTSEEIEYLIEMGTREGVLDEVKEELLNSVLEFADRVVKEIMVPRTRMVAIDRDAPPDEIVRVVTENPYSRMPVYEGSVDNIVGILMVRDIIGELKRGALKAIPFEKLLKPAFFVPEQMKVSRLLKEMQRRKTHLAVVVDEFGGTSGVVTLEDVLEEIVGEIQDEADAEAAPVKALGPNAWIADATVPLRELEEFLNREGEGSGELGGEVRFPSEGDYETLGGFVTATAGRVPHVGAVLEWDGLTFTVRAGDERRVTRVEIVRREAPRPAEASAVPQEA
ncbi:MAG TPA: hemolysin family protein [Anaeromyxobacteraceae bacterium]|nr:hemolysin family protein [Anaeromyxobacteraceae bacterium]